MGCDPGPDSTGDRNRARVRLGNRQYTIAKALVRGRLFADQETWTAGTGCARCVLVFKIETAVSAALIAIAAQIKDSARVEDMVIIADRSPPQMCVFDKQDKAEAEINDSHFPGEHPIAHQHIVVVGRCTQTRRLRLRDRAVVKTIWKAARLPAVSRTPGQTGTRVA